MSSLTPELVNIQRESRVRMKPDTLWLRAQVIQSIRDFFRIRGFLEVETPILIPANAPEEYIDPISSQNFFLHTSPEICMKRLLCRGYTDIFQICRCWRSGERGSRHLSEFTMLEWYRAGADYTDLMNDCRELLRHVAIGCLPSPHFFKHKGVEIDPHTDWHTITVKDAFASYARSDVRKCIAEGTYENILTDIVEPAFAQFLSPVFLSDYPSELAALSRIKEKQPDIAERFELYVGSVELANGFSELTDPLEQRRRFDDANKVRVASGRKALPLPEPFLSELENMPPSAGIALGVDRLIMLVCGTDLIDDIIAFTPEDL